MILLEINNRIVEETLTLKFNNAIAGSVDDLFLHYTGVILKSACSAGCPAAAPPPLHALPNQQCAHQKTGSKDIPACGCRSCPHLEISNYRVLEYSVVNE